MKSANQVYANVQTTVFETMSRLAIEHNAINLGQGFPDVDGPEDIRRIAAEALVEGPNQYPPMMGIEDLRKAVAGCNKRFYGLEVDWQQEVLVTSGATEALADSIFGLVEDGDEVVLIEPLYDCYLSLVRRAGAVVKSVQVEPPDWKLDLDALESAFSGKTKLILLNNPMNPTAKVFDRTELEKIAALCRKYDAVAVCDEVYEHIVFDSKNHIPLMTMAGMRDRTVRIGSAGKTFSLTGWKVGYVTAPQHLLKPISKAHQYMTFATPPNLQRAVAFGLNKDNDYFSSFTLDMQNKRDTIRDGLESIGIPVLPCDGTYFVTCDLEKFDLGDNDVDIARRLTVEAGVASVPVSAFYIEDGPKSLVRFCFCKRDELLNAALSKLGDFLN